MNKILQEVLKRVQPNEKEVTQITELAQRLLDKASSNKEISFSPLIVGSVAKGTFLKGADIDLFLRLMDFLKITTSLKSVQITGVM